MPHTMQLFILRIQITVHNQISADRDSNQKNSRELKGTFGKDWELLGTFGITQFAVNHLLIFRRDKTFFKPYPFLPQQPYESFSADSIFISQLLPGLNTTIMIFHSDEILTFGTI